MFIVIERVLYFGTANSNVPVALTFGGTQIALDDRELQLLRPRYDLFERTRVSAAAHRSPPCAVHDAAVALEETRCDWKTPNAYVSPRHRRRVVRKRREVPPLRGRAGARLE